MNYNNSRFLLSKRPRGMPENDCWTLNSEIIKDLNNGEVLIQTEYRYSVWIRTSPLFKSLIISELRVQQSFSGIPLGLLLNKKRELL